MGSCSSKQKSGDDYEDALRDALQKARIEVKRQTNHATLIKKDLAKMRYKVDELKDQMKDMENVVKMQINKLKEKETLLQNSRQETQELTLKLNMFSENILTLKKDIRVLESKWMKMNDELQASMTIIAAKDKFIRELETEIETTNKKSTDIIFENEMLKQENTKLDEELEDLRNSRPRILGIF